MIPETSTVFRSGHFLNQIGFVCSVTSHGYLFQEFIQSPLNPCSHNIFCWGALQVFCLKKLGNSKLTSCEVKSGQNSKTKLTKSNPSFLQHIPRMNTEDFYEPVALSDRTHPFIKYLFILQQYLGYSKFPATLSKWLLCITINGHSIKFDSFCIDIINLVLESMSLIHEFTRLSSLWHFLVCLLGFARIL